MAEDDTDRTRPPLPGMPEIDRELERLRERLGALHESVDDLGRRPPPNRPPRPPSRFRPGPARRAPPPGPPAASAASERRGASTMAGAPVFAPPPATPPPPPPRPGPPPITPVSRYGAAAPSPLAAGDPGAGGPPPAPAPSPPPVGSPVLQPGPEEQPSAGFVVVDAGPIAGLAAARRFEDALAALPAVREVRLRRFARHRAELEVGLSEPHALGPELPMLELPARIETFKRDRLVLRVGEGAESS